LCLNSIFKYAVESNQLEAVLHLVTHLDDWAYELKLDKQQVRQLVSSILPGLQNTPDARELVIRFLQTFENGEALGEYESLVQKMLINFMKGSNADATELDELLLDCPSLSSLKGKPVYELLEIFANGTSQQFQAFASANSTFLSESGIDTASARNAISLGTFARLCSTARVVTYEEVAKALSISEDEVEFTAIEAVTQGLVDVRLNQPEKTITVKYARQRHFTEKEWKQLGQRVESFKSNILELVKVLEEAKHDIHKQ